MRASPSTTAEESGSVNAATTTDDGTAPTIARKCGYLKLSYEYRWPGSRQFTLLMYRRRTSCGEVIPVGTCAKFRSRKENIAAFTPIPRPSVSTTANVNPGDRRSPRQA